VERFYSFRSLNNLPLVLRSRTLTPSSTAQRECAKVRAKCGSGRAVGWQRRSGRRGHVPHPPLRVSPRRLRL